MSAYEPAVNEKMNRDKSHDKCHDIRVAYPTVEASPFQGEIAVKFHQRQT